MTHADQMPDKWPEQPKAYLPEHKWPRPERQAGRKDDTEKVRMELIPYDAVWAIAQVLTFGAKKYADRNWELGISYSRVFGATMRHLTAWWQGKGPTNKSFLFGDTDPETQFSHLWHAGCCILFLIAYEMRTQNKTSFDDRPISLLVPITKHPLKIVMEEVSVPTVSQEWAMPPAGQAPEFVPHQYDPSRDGVTK